MSESQRHASGSVTRWLVGGIPLVVALGLGVLFAIPAECPTCYGGKPIWIGLAGIPPLAPNPCPSCLQQRHVSLAKAWYLRAMGTNEISRSPSLSTLIVMAIACIAVMSWVSFVPIARCPNCSGTGQAPIEIDGWWVKRHGRFSRFSQGPKGISNGAVSCERCRTKGKVTCLSAWTLKPPSDLD
jgi:hypothetical protein